MIPYSLTVVPDAMLENDGFPSASMIDVKLDVFGNPVKVICGLPYKVPVVVPSYKLPCDPSA